MATGLIALLDDVAAIAKVAASSLDDVAAATAKAGAKSAGVVIDDAAVTPTYVTGFTPDRELPIIWKIAKGSLFNKLVFLTPAFIALAAFLPQALTPLLMVGGAFLCFEAAGSDAFSDSAVLRACSSWKIADAGAHCGFSHCPR
jgi:predicted DNA repair protein MutK